MNDAVLTLIILGITIVCLIAEVFPPAVTALLACCAMAFCGVAKPSVAFCGFSDSSTLMLLAMLVFGTTLSSTGVLRCVSRKIMGITRGKMKYFIPTYLFLMFIVSAFLKNSTAFVILIPFFSGVLLVQPDSERYSSQRFVFLACAAVYDGGLFSMAGRSATVAASAATEKLIGQSFSFFQFAPIALLFFVLDGVYWFLFTRKLTGKMNRRNGISPFVRENAIQIGNDGAEEHLSKKGIVCLIIFVLVIIGLLTEDLHGYSNSLVCMTGMALCLAAGCTSRKELGQKLQWNVLLVFAAMLGMAEIFSESGAGELLANLLVRSFGKYLNPIPVLFGFGFVMMLLSQFLSAIVSVQFLLPLAYTLAAQMGINFMPFAVMIALCASALPVLPTSSSVSMLAMDWGNYRYRDYVVLMAPLEAIHLVAVTALVPLLYPF